ncbi:MAG: VPLPA-CTERM sorting domain-containing protein [Pseudomonadota bacterium]
MVRFHMKNLVSVLDRHANMAVLRLIFWRLLACGCAAFALAMMMPIAASAATIIIDDFSTPQGPLTATGSLASSIVATPGAIGGTTRELRAISGSGSVTAEVAGGAFQVTGSNLTNTSPLGVNIAYPSIRTTFPVIDLTDGGMNDTLFIVLLETSNTADLRFEVDLVGFRRGNNFATPIPSGITTPTTLAFSFADVVSPGGGDVRNLTDIGAVVFSIAQSPSAGSTGPFSVTVDEIRVGAAPQIAIPLPAAGWLLLVAVGGFGLAARKTSG